MAVPRTTIWDLAPHTEAKHVILKRYLGAWFPILSRYSDRILYIDGFAGPGRYSKGEAGSPLIALDVANTHRGKLAGELIFRFVEREEARVTHLRAEIDEMKLPKHFNVRAEHGRFDATIGPLLDELKAETTPTPAFAFIDPFGISGYPYSIVSRLLSQPRTEVLVTFMADALNRWLTHPSEEVTTHIVDTFGDDEPLAIAKSTGNRIERLRIAYQERLSRHARFVRYFEMRDRDNRVQYYLFFATNNELGHVKMKEAMWKVDPDGSFSFSDATDPNQGILLQPESAPALASLLVAKYRGTTATTTDEVQKFVEDATPFLKTHMKSALKQLAAKNTIKVAETKTDGSRRKGGTFPSKVVLYFPSGKSKPL